MKKENKKSDGLWVVVQPNSILWNYILKSKSRIGKQLRKAIKNGEINSKIPIK